jgi:hypothetical protein
MFSFIQNALYLKLLHVKMVYELLAFLFFCNQYHLDSPTI